MSIKMQQRKPSLDVIRCFALLFVISVHFFLKSGYYYVPMQGTRMLVMTVMRTFFMICVPLFMMLTGYLTCTKTISRSYYIKIIYILSIYLLASLCCTAYSTMVLHTPTTLYGFIFNLFSFKGSPYAWYVEMYVGLFLLCPLLNVLYHHLNGKKEKLVLVWTLIFLTSLPRILNIYEPHLNWFLHPTTSDQYFQFIPDYWCGLYPITYYCIGCYLREFKLKLSCTKIFCLSVALGLLFGLFNYYRSYGGPFISNLWTDHSVFPTLIQSVLFFAFFDNLTYRDFSTGLAKGIQKLSSLTFGAYLVSWIFDDIIYSRLNSSIPDATLRLNYFVPVVLFVFVGSLLLSYGIETLYRVLSRGAGWIVRRLSSLRQTNQ